jgi:hypothetical protein
VWGDRIARIVIKDPGQYYNFAWLLVLVWVYGPKLFYKFKFKVRRTMFGIVIVSRLTYII